VPFLDILAGFSIVNYWLITDTHFGHGKLEQRGCRSGDWQQQLWAGLAAIPQADTLIHLGDVCVGDDAGEHATLASQVRCRKVLVRGNHDRKSGTWYLEHGWDFVCDGLHLAFMGHIVLLTHRPAPPDRSRFTRNIHGHTHGDEHRAAEHRDWYAPDYHIDICPEIVGYRSLRLATILEAASG
jgi:calcineurin-like phosphoesterase family protein